MFAAQPTSDPDALPRSWATTFFFFFSFFFSLSVSAAPNSGNSFLSHAPRTLPFGIRPLFRLVHLLLLSYTLGIGGQGRAIDRSLPHRLPSSAPRHACHLRQRRPYTYVIGLDGALMVAAAVAAES